MSKGFIATVSLGLVSLVSGTQPLLPGDGHFRIDPGFSSTINSDTSDPAVLSTEGQRSNPVDFTAEELKELQRRFGVHGPQPELAQLLTLGLDQLTPLRARTVNRLEQLQPIILRESRLQGVNPMLVAAVLFDELQHAKPGEDLPLAVESGLFKTHGPAQLSVGELVHQGLLRPDASEAELSAARQQLLDPERNVVLLVGKFSRLSRALALPTERPLDASSSPRDAKALATLAYLHNGKLDYPARILSYMQDPSLHALIYSIRKPILSPVI
ncbi:helicase DnaB [Synechococcus sp. CS-1325]|uniref:helicase DnaB n=1 Tax=Synechococcus sp. CS-1325 TaxID=2847979 RepID=UPI000DB551F0|nr:helicase DnaB [Synechococcus sp. CS-1325]MCT0199386.1 helicase DnaB [Synechococcus sp. CS-1325]PZV03001.1 MAG: helicase DnaB [Cyanobium sp.]